jgi:hypothetical protein
MDKTLKMEHPMMHGPAVKRLQEVGDHLGYDYGPNDGIFGEDTQDMVMAYQIAHGLVVDGIVGPKTWGHMTKMMDAVSGEAGICEGLNLVHDIRGAHPPPKHYARKRTWNQIVGVTLHQTGCNMPQKPESWKRLNAHIGITQEGLAVLVNDPTDMIWHAQGLSKSTIGIEIEGNFQGLMGNDRTLWRGGGGPHFLNDKMKDALQEVFIWLRAGFQDNGAEWHHIFGHRQSSETRRGDPGSQIWNEVATPWATLLGMKHECDGGQYYSIGSGKPIPKLWNPEYIGKY